MVTAAVPRTMVRTSTKPGAEDSASTESAFSKTVGATSIWRAG